jgi:hydrogenase nickel incorporation protein HypA/HybF
MHEVSLMQNAVDLAVDYALAHDAKRIERLTLRVGELSGVVIEALEFAFDAVTQGTIAESAELCIEKIPAICYCADCQVEFHPLDWIYQCPKCRRICTAVLQGQELELAAMEVS